MSAMLWRVLVAVIAVVLFYLLLPPLARIIGFPLSGDVILVVKICVAGLAALYIIKGGPPWA